MDNERLKQVSGIGILETGKLEKSLRQALGKI